MAHMLRLGDCSRVLKHSVSYAIHISASTKQSLIGSRLHSRYQLLNNVSPGQDLLADVSSQRSVSGFAKIKPDSALRPKSQWKKKKKKTSSINKKIHSDLVEVLNKRAVQLVFSREANQLHRTLVTNFSFMDFPLQNSGEPVVNSVLNQMQVTDKAMETCVKLSSQSDFRVAEHNWVAQFSSFDKQLQNMVTSHQGHSVVDVSRDYPFTTETNCDISGHRGEFVSEDGDTQCVLDGNFLSSDFETVVTKSLEQSPTPLLPPKPEPSDAIKSSSQNLPQKPVKPPVKSNANILKTKKVQKAKKSPQVPAEVSPSIISGTLTSDIQPDADTVEVSDELEGIKLPKNLSKAELQRLRKSRADREKFQANPAKFNHYFNQELLAYVDACCFAGLEYMAHSILKQNHHNRTTDKKSLPGMRQIQDINIYNKIMHAWAKKGHMDHIRELFTMLKEDGLSPNLQSFAAVWECLGRQQTVDVDTGQGVLDEMEREGLDVTDLINQSFFSKDEQQVILKAITAVNPLYFPKPAPQPLPPSGPLVDGLGTATPPDQVVEKNPYAEMISHEAAHSLLETQMQRELRGSVSVKSILKQSNPSHRTLDYRKKLSGLKEEWRGLLIKAFEKKLRFMARRAKLEYGMTMYPYLKVLEPQDYVQCLMQEVEELASTSDSFSPNKTFLWKRLSGRVYSKYVMTEKLRNKVPKKMSHLYQKYVDSFLKSDLDLSTHRELWQSLIANSPEGSSLDIPEKIWPAHIFLALGKLLYELIIYDLKVDTNILKETPGSRNMVPAFYTIYRNYAHQTMEEIKPHPVLVKLYQGAELNELSFDASFLPMLIPPVPWISTNHGGYLLNAVRLVRIPMQAQAQTEKVQETVATSQLSAVLDSINTLSACAWIINKRVLDIIIDVFNNKGEPSLDIPPPASECPAPPKITQNMTSQEKSVAFRQRQKLRTQKAEMYSLWCQELYKLSIANQFRDEVFWFPHNLDFRGRTYPCAPHFNHLGSDITRSILMFAKGKPLGPRGLDWMKIHLINLTGFKKRSPNRERLAYANEMLDEIFDSADNPFTGNKWWQKSDEPWQTLACCMEIANAIRSPDPEQYVCHLPIHQDGSCNGLQHYAALGRDKAGAQSVNLWPYDRPQDVYSDVCEMVEREREKDAAEGVEIAKHLEGFVRRKVIKQTVMTTVYGVTRYGAKAQILRQLKDIPDFPQAQVWNGSLYLTEKTFQCLNEMFSATKDIQDWLTLSAQLISTVCQRPVEWVTPVGLTVVQPYHKPLAVQRFGINTNDHWNYFEKPNAMKQKNAFPPNFIHSLDSTHMMLTALYCMRAGITFVSVHDCFWTHACDVEIMNKVCREQFVALHKQPILEDLSRQLINLYTPDSGSSEVLETPVVKAQQFLHSVLANVPARGNFDLDKVLESTYFFS